MPDYVPIRFAVEHLSEAQVNVEELGRQGDVDSGVLGQDGKGGVEGFLVRVWSANWVNAHVGVGRDGTIKTFDRASEVRRWAMCDIVQDALLMCVKNA